MTPVDYRPAARSSDAHVPALTILSAAEKPDGTRTALQVQWLQWNYAPTQWNPAPIFIRVYNDARQAPDSPADAYAEVTREDAEALLDLLAELLGKTVTDPPLPNLAEGEVVRISADAYPRETLTEHHDLTVVGQLAFVVRGVPDIDGDITVLTPTGKSYYVNRRHVTVVEVSD